MLRQSGLIFGSRVLLTRVVELHQIRLNSNPGCPLCMALASSYDKIDISEQDDQEPLSGYGTFWSRTRPTKSAEEGDPLITAEHGTVMLKVEASSFNPVRTPLIKTSNRYSEIFNTNVPRYSDCHLQLRRSDGKVSEKIHLARGMDVSFLM
jgi:hypothetical protein